MNGCFRYVKQINDNYVVKMPLAEHQQEALDARDISKDYYIERSEEEAGWFSNLSELAVYQKFGDKCGTLCPIDLEKSSGEKIYMRLAKLPVLDSDWDDAGWSREDKEIIRNTMKDFYQEYNVNLSIPLYNLNKSTIEEECGDPLEAFKRFYLDMVQNLPQNVCQEIFNDMHCNNWGIVDGRLVTIDYGATSADSALYDEGCC